MNGFNTPSDKPVSLFVIIWVSFFVFLITIPISQFLNPEYLDSLLFLQIPDRLWLGIVYLSFLSIVLAYWFYLEAVKRLNASRATIFINLIPVWGISLSVLFLGELLDPLIYISAFLLIYTGMYLVNQSQNQ